MKEIPLTQGYVALVDDEDYEWLSQWKWCVSKSYNTYYAKRNDGIMHRVILGVKTGEIVDHINRDGLDNRRENLRIASPNINRANSRKGSNNASGFVGVYWSRKGNGWIANTGFNNKTIQSGLCGSAIGAALIRDEAIRRLWGNDVYLNFPDEKPSQEIIDEVDRIFAKHGLG